jgi:hypothetical protein
MIGGSEVTSSQNRDGEHDERPPNERGSGAEEPQAGGVGGWELSRDRGRPDHIYREKLVGYIERSWLAARKPVMAARSISATGKSQHMPSPASTILGCGVSTVRHCSLINDDCPLLGTGPWSSREPRSLRRSGWRRRRPAARTISGDATVPITSGGGGLEPNPIEPLTKTAGHGEHAVRAAVSNRQVSFLQLSPNAFGRSLDCSRLPGAHPGTRPGGNNDRPKAEH